MKTITAVAAKKIGKFLANDFREIFGSSYNHVAERLGSLARSAIECLGRSDALYHNFEHTLLVTMVGRDIMRGRTLCERIEPTDYDHLIVACLLHDIGYVRGVLSADTETEFVIDKSGKTVTLPRGASDASLAPYHVDRSKLFVFERLGKSPTIDAERVAEAIEIHPLPAALGPQGRERRARAQARASRRPHRSTRRSLVSEEGERPFLRVRGDRPEPATRLRLTGRSHREISGFLLEQRRHASRGRHEISEPHRLRPPMDRKSPQPRLVRRAFPPAHGAAKLKRAVGGGKHRAVKSVDDGPESKNRSRPACRSDRP